MSYSYIVNVMSSLHDWNTPALWVCAKYASITRSPPNRASFQRLKAQSPTNKKADHVCKKTVGCPSSHSLKITSLRLRSAPPQQELSWTESPWLRSFAPVLEAFQVLRLYLRFCVCRTRRSPVGRVDALQFSPSSSRCQSTPEQRPDQLDGSLVFSVKKKRKKRCVQPIAKK